MNKQGEKMTNGMVMDEIETYMRENCKSGISAFLLVLDVNKVNEEHLKIYMGRFKDKFTNNLIVICNKDDEIIDSGEATDYNSDELDHHLARLARDCREDVRDALEEVEKNVNPGYRDDGKLQIWEALEKRVDGIPAFHFNFKQITSESGKDCCPSVFIKERQLEESRNICQLEKLTMAIRDQDQSPYFPPSRKNSLVYSSN